MSTPWPPPPDLESLKELFAAADVEGLIAEDAPTDEYDPEAKHFLEIIQGMASKELTIAVLLPLLEELWVKQFMLNGEQRAQRRPVLLALAQQIERFFGPSAQPHVR